jgi:hypothetical protein
MRRVPCQLPNGITALLRGVLLVADSVKGLIWRVDVASRGVSVWSDSALLGGFNPQIKPAIPAVNGLKRHGQHLYASNMSLNHFVRIAIRRRRQRWCGRRLCQGRVRRRLRDRPRRPHLRHDARV